MVSRQGAKQRRPNWGASHRCSGLGGRLLLGGGSLARASGTSRVPGTTGPDACRGTPDPDAAIARSRCRRFPFVLLLVAGTWFVLLAVAGPAYADPAQGGDGSQP